MLVTVASFTNPWDAHIVRGLLESEEILAFVATEHQIYLKWPMSQALGGVCVQVPMTLAPRAQHALAALADGEYQRALEADFDLAPITCPQCASSDFRNVRSRRMTLLAIVLLMLASITFPPPIIGRRCKSCGTRVDYSL